MQREPTGSRSSSSSTASFLHQADAKSRKPVVARAPPRALPRSSALEFKASAVRQDTKHEAKGGARLLGARSQPQLLAEVRTLCQPGATPDARGCEQLRVIARTLASSADADWIAPLVAAAGGIFMPDTAVQPLLAGAGAHPRLPDLASDLVDAFGGVEAPVPRLRQVLSALAQLPHDADGAAFGQAVHRLMQQALAWPTRADLRDAIIAAVARQPTQRLADALGALLDALEHPVPGEPARRELRPAATPPLRALFNQALQRPGLQHQALLERAMTLVQATQGRRMPIELHESLLSEVLGALADFGRLAPEADPFFAPPLQPLDQGLSGQVLGTLCTRPGLPANARHFVELALAQVHSCADRLRPEMLTLLYRELTRRVVQVSAVDKTPIRNLIDQAVWLAPNLSLAQFHAVVQAITRELAGHGPAIIDDGMPTVRDAFYHALAENSPTMSAAAAATLAAALYATDDAALPAGQREGARDNHLTTLANLALLLTPAQAVACVMGLCSTHARRHGGREGQAMRQLKSHLDQIRRATETDPSARSRADALARYFTLGWTLARDPQQLVIPATAPGISFSEDEVIGLLQVAYALPATDEAAPDSAGMAEFTALTIAPHLKAEVVQRTWQGRGLPLDAVVLGELHGRLLEQQASLLPARDSKSENPTARKAAALKALAFARESVIELLRFYESLDLAMHIGVPNLRWEDPQVQVRTRAGYPLLARCIREVEAVIAPLDPALSQGLKSRLDTSHQVLARRLGMGDDRHDLAIKHALMNRLDRQGVALQMEAAAARLIAPQDRKAEQATVRQALLALPADPQEAPQALVVLAPRLAAAARSEHRRALTAEISAIAAEHWAPPLFALVARELARSLGGAAIHPRHLGALLEELTAPPLGTGHAGAAVAGLAKGVGGPDMSEDSLFALVTPLLEPGPEAPSSARRDAMVAALAQALSPQRRIWLVGRIAGCDLPGPAKQALMLAMGRKG